MTIRSLSRSLLEDSDTATPLWRRITSWNNLLSAYHKAALGKRGLKPAATFDYRVADRLLELRSELLEDTYRPGRYTHFFVHEPKRRKISAAPFRDRVVHHALCNQIEPIFERRFHPDSYANRKGKGTHAAVDRLQTFARQYRYVLRADVIKHFPSLDHAILRDELAKYIQDDRTLTLIDHILASGAGVLADEYEMVYFPGDDLFAANRLRGLPIGNLTSQFWSNCYMNPFDWFVTRTLGCRAYVRYVDDFALFSNSKRELATWKQEVGTRLARLRLTIHETEAQIAESRAGVPWLGFVVYPNHRLLKRRNVINFERRTGDRINDYSTWKISFAELDAGIQGWINHVRYADTWGLRTHLFNHLPLIVRGIAPAFG